MNLLVQTATVLGQAATAAVFRSKPVTRADIPASFAALNPEWLSAALCRDVPNARVVSFQLLDGDSGSTNRQRIAVQYNETGTAAGLPTALFSKAAMSFVNRMSAGATGSMLCECEFYTHVRPRLNIEAPRAAFANYDSRACTAIILLVDLAATGGATFCHPLSPPLGRDQIEWQLETLAKFHGPYLGNVAAPELARLPDWETLFNQIMRIAMVRVYGRKGLLAAEDVVPKGVLRRSRDIWSATCKANELGHAMPRTLTHGDVHLRNWYVTDAGKMGLADWQTAAKGPLARDLAYTIASALTVADRRNWERDLIRFYLDRLHAVSGRAIGFDKAFLHYRQQLVSALALWTPTLRPPPFLPLMQPEAVSREFIKRITHAMDDVESLSALEITS